MKIESMGSLCSCSYSFGHVQNQKPIIISVIFLPIIARGPVNKGLSQKSPKKIFGFFSLFIPITLTPGKIQICTKY